MCKILQVKLKIALSEAAHGSTPFECDSKHQSKALYTLQVSTWINDKGVVFKWNPEDVTDARCKTS